MTLAKVAKEAGVSITTASKVFNNDPTVRSYLRERVMEVAEAMNYRPNALARGLRTRYANLVSVGIQEIDNPFFGRMTQGISSGLLAENFGAIICNNIDRVNEINQTAKAAGTILVSPSEGHIREVVQERALVTITASKPQLKLAPNVGIAFDKAYTLMCEELIRQGRTRVGYYCPSASWPVNYNSKYKHVDRALKSAEVKIINPSQGSYETTKDIAALLSRDRNALDAVICMNDVGANELAHKLWDIGINPRRDVLVVGCDGTVLDDGFWTIKVDIDEIAAKAVELLLAGIKGETSPRQIEVVPAFVCP
ncbi:MAG: LacI family DNA-binding transcriptional regulator [Planctomycetes bacterium]|nr:LacI family DNA-binding transcriptional regulator [Planctomycetota bacterium]